MANNNQDPSALCAEAMKLGLTSTEFWRQVRRNPAAEEDMTLAAEDTLSDLRAGGTDCPKCKGTGRFINAEGEDRGICFMCKGKGFEDVKDQKRNYGYRKNKPGRQELYFRD